MDLDHDIGKITGNLSILDPGGSVLNVIGTTGVVLPVGTTAQRPANQIGTMRYNSTLGGIEYNTGSTWQTLGTSSTSGTVTSVAISAPSEFTVTGSPVTSSGTLTLTKAPQAKNLVFAGPTTGANAEPSFRSLAIANGDISDIQVLSPTNGQALIYDGTKWTNLGQSGGTNGGGAAKRIWSNNILASSGTTTLTPSTTPPVNTSGTQVWSQTITPFSVDASYVIQTSVSAAASQNGANLSLLLFRDGVYLGSTVQIANSSNNSATLTITITDKPATLSPVVYQVRVATSTGTWYLNRRTSEVTYGGMYNGWVIWEY